MSNKSWLPETPSRRLGDRVVGIGNPVYITGEIGINHNGELVNARLDRQSSRCGL